VQHSILLCHTRKSMPPIDALWGSLACLFSKVTLHLQQN
jgi:hypothetical protein